MLPEALNFAATYMISPRRKAGEINSSVMLWARARRCARDWAAHEENSQSFVHRLVEILPQRRTVVVLGSGLLRDTPVETLSQAFGSVRLYDLQHLTSVRAWARVRGLNNLSFENRDLSGFEALRTRPDQEPRPLAFLRDIQDLDLVISANLLSQIGVGIGQMIADDASAPRDAVPRLLRAHVDGLAALHVPAGLITDISYEVRDKSGRMLENCDLMHGVALPALEAEWSWPVAPFGELDPTYQAVHRVVAIRMGPQER
jgi:hypothetical protein